MLGWPPPLRSAAPCSSLPVRRLPRLSVVNHRPRGYRSRAGQDHDAGLHAWLLSRAGPAGQGHGHILRPVLVVQERRRFYRESMTAFLRRQLGTTEVGAGVADADRLLAVAERGRLDHAVIEADGVPWDVGALAASLRDRHQDIHLIGLTTSGRPARYEGIAVVPRNATPDQVVKLVEPDADRATPFVLSVATGNGSGPLTDQQLRVLALLSLGLTVVGCGGSPGPVGAGRGQVEGGNIRQSSASRARPRPSPPPRPPACSARPPPRSREVTA